MNVNGKYLKDENGNIISPITSTKSIYNSINEDLDTILGKVYKRTKIYEGSTTSTATLTMNTSNFDILIMCFEANHETNYYYKMDMIPANSNYIFNVEIRNIYDSANVSQSVCSRYMVNGTSFEFIQGGYINVNHNLGSFIGGDVKINTRLMAVLGLSL